MRENLASTAAQQNSAREQVLQAEAHLSFAQLHMAAAQRFQTPAEEVVAPSSAPSIPAGAQLVRALTEARGFEAAGRGAGCDTGRASRATGWGSIGGESMTPVDSEGAPADILIKNYCKPLTRN